MKLDLCMLGLVQSEKGLCICTLGPSSLRIKCETYVNGFCVS